MAASRFDPEGMAIPCGLLATGWAWYLLDTMLMLVGTENADPATRPALMDGTPPPFWRLSDLARIVELGDQDPWTTQVARELLAAVAGDLVATPGFA